MVHIWPWARDWTPLLEGIGTVADLFQTYIMKQGAGYSILTKQWKGRL